MSAGMEVRDWRPMRRGALLGFVKIATPSGLVMVDITVMNGERGPWCGMPSKPMLDRDGVAMKDQAGRVRYVALIEFTSKEAREKFSAAVIEALRSSHPGVFQ